MVHGEKWRTGANATTKIDISSDIEINGQLLSKGSYALLTTPGQDAWTFHFYSYTRMAYTKFMDKEPALELTVATHKNNFNQESLSIHFDHLN